MEDPGEIKAFIGDRVVHMHQVIQSGDEEDVCLEDFLDDREREVSEVPDNEIVLGSDGKDIRCSGLICAGESGEGETTEGELIETESKLDLDLSEILIGLIHRTGEQMGETAGECDSCAVFDVDMLEWKLVRQVDERPRSGLEKGIEDGEKERNRGTGQELMEGLGGVIAVSSCSHGVDDRTKGRSAHRDQSKDGSYESEEIKPPEPPTYEA